VRSDAIRSVRLQLLVTAAALATVVAVFAVRGLPPTLNVIIAIEYHNLVETRRSLNWGTDVNRRAMVSVYSGPYSETLLHSAATYRDRPIAELLLERGADVSAVTDYNRTPLGEAAGRGDLDMLSLFLDHGADRLELALVRATICGQTEAARLLLDRGADVNGQVETEYRTTEAALHAAARNGTSGVIEYHDLVRLLLARGARIDARNADGLTPLQLAVEHERTSIAGLLRRHGATE